MYLFDMDGTLIDSNGVWKDVDREFLARRGLPYTRAYYEGVAHTIFPLAAKFTKEFCHLPESEEAIMAEWMELAKDAYAHVTVKPGVRAFLKQCRMENRRMALVTSSVPVHCRTAMEKLGLMKYFASKKRTSSSGSPWPGNLVWSRRAARCLMTALPPAGAPAAQKCGWWAFTMTFSPETKRKCAPSVMSISPALKSSCGGRRLVPYKSTQKIAAPEISGAAIFVAPVFQPSSFVRLQAASTAAMQAPRKPRSSSAATPAMVLPPGLHTSSFKSSGCLPDWSTSAALPRSICAA